MREFNITGTCYPSKHYMVNISQRVDTIKQKVKKGEYLTINRGRQYGKTTTLYHLAENLRNDYLVFALSFETFAESDYCTDEALAYSLLEAMWSEIENGITQNADDCVKETLSNAVKANADKREVLKTDLGQLITSLCRNSSKPIVVLIDEVDSASNYNSFIELLKLLRDKYLKREKLPTFQSVILAGVYDIKNLKLKVRPDNEHQYNSPWNIAVAFDKDMSFSKDQIAQMVSDYEADHKTGMNVDEISSLIEDYTSGYPFLVSKLCKLIDENNLGWNKEGVVKAVKILLVEKNTLFDDLVKKLEDFPEIKQILKEMLYYGKGFSFNPDNKVLNLAAMFNYISNNNGRVKVSNRIMETRIYNLFMSEEEMTNSIYREGQVDKSQFIDGNCLKMDKILERFAVHFNDIYGDKGDKFCEDEGRRYFMLYVRPIINGTGNYYIEAQTRDLSRTDMIIDYLGTQYIIEMKIWRGNSYNERGESQLAEYLDFYHTNKGYMLSFCFNKNKPKPIAKSIKIGDKEIVEVVV